MITALVIFSLVMLVVFAFGPTFKLSEVVRDRKYKSGTGWCFWRWTEVTDNNYILRLHIFKSPWFAVCLHWIDKPDAEPWLHDHPVSFLSIILRGSYTELRKIGDGEPFHKVNRWFNFVRASHEDRHRIVLARHNTLTLCLMGPKSREWGFHVWKELCPKGTATPGWIMWKRYYQRLRDGEDMRRYDAALETGAAAALAGGRKVVRFNEAYAGGTRVDVDKRAIDTAPADDFKAEPPTEPGRG